MKYEVDFPPHLGDVDIVQLLDGGLDLVLVGLDVADEDEGVVVLDLLHGGLGGQGVLDDVVGILRLKGEGRMKDGKISWKKNS